ncbi:MAG: T9SS type A sorting domain-containing protein [Candidatus Krumholzibacteriota bacterium]|nr:T9SS type A sorting domain-containing protein [Candidatus Krumholzibacteriota bacterium]
MRIKELFLLGGCLSAILIPLQANSQYQIVNGTFNSAGGTNSGSNKVYFSVGQPAVSSALTGGSYQVLSGFWHQAWISSTVEVAITSFAGKLEGESVRLLWTIGSSTTCRGFNLYRSETGEGDFDRLNQDLIPPGVMEYYDPTALPGKTYHYRLEAVEEGGRIFFTSLALSLPALPLTLYQNYPNPFNPETQISFFIPQRSRVRVDIFNVKGRRVVNLLHGYKETGRYTIAWNGKDDQGRRVQSGIYYCRLTALKKILTKKMVLLR